MKITEFKTKEEMMLAYPLICQLHGGLDKKSYEEIVDELMQERNYVTIGIYDKKTLIAVASYWLVTRFYCGKSIHIGNMVVDENYRNKGIGKKLIKYIEEKGKEFGCKKYILDSYFHNTKSHKLYFNEGFYIRGFHFMKDI